MVVFEVRNSVPTEDMLPERRATSTPPRCSKRNKDTNEPNADPIRFAEYNEPISFVYDLKTSERHPPHKR